MSRFILGSQFDMTRSAQRQTLPVHDAELSRNLSEIRTMGQQFGLAMEGSARAISESVAMLARLHFDEVQGGLHIQDMRRRRSATFL